MRWRKCGLVFTPPGNAGWMASHAAVPIADHICDSCYRVYFTGRDVHNRSHVGAFTLNLAHPQAYSDLSPSPVLAPGEPGAFDDSGAMTAWLVNDQGTKYLYYLGWNAGLNVPFYNTIGLAVSEDNGRSYRKISRGPIVGRDDVDPLFVAAPGVLRDGPRWRMWYPSCVRWERWDSGLRPRYHIKYAESADGIHWTKTNVVCIDFRSPEEYAIARPCVLKGSRGYRMWYCSRGSSYRIGYAESHDGVQWNRKDEHVGIDVSADGWDAEMIAYPYVFQHEEQLYMLYNGNGYGRTGIGLAVLLEE